MKKYPSITGVIGVLLCGILFCFWGWYNGYPFVYPDTGTYVDSGFQNYVPGDRPVTYGLFVRHASLAESLIWVMVAQGILSVLLVREWMKAFSEKAPSPVGLITAVVFLISCTDASIYASYVLPDFFTPIFYGLLVLILLTPVKRWRTPALALMAILAAMTHNSHLLGGLVFVGSIFLYQVFVRQERRFSWANIGVVAGAVLASWLSLFALHFSINKKWEIMRDGHAFTMGRLHEIGLLKQYLNEKCAHKELYLCSAKDSMPDDILWDTNSPLNKNGGWDAVKKENQFIIGDILTTPRFLKRYLIESFNGTIKQFFYFRAENIGPIPGGGSPLNSVTKYFPNELIDYKIAHQNHRYWFLDIEGLNTRQQYLFFACLILMVLLWTTKSWQTAIPEVLQKAYNLLFLCLVTNAFVCATFSTVVSRYQGRLIWLYIFTGAMIFTIRYTPVLRKYLSPEET